MKKLTVNIFTYICIGIIIIGAIAGISSKFSQDSAANVKAAMKKAESDFPGYKFKVAGYNFNFNTKSYTVTLCPESEKVSAYIHYEVQKTADDRYYLRCTGGKNIDYLMPDGTLNKDDLYKSIIF